MQKLTAQDAETKSPDLAAENLAQLRALFPELVTEGPEGIAVNLDVLKQLVGDKTVTDAEEKYGLNWHGKRRARQIALAPSTGTLRPCPEDSVDWDTTQNLMIEGDNLEVLKLLQRSYAGKVKLIYIDPPYNTGKDFVYPDNFQDNIKNYLELTGQTGDGGQKLSSNTEASGRFHTDWLNMMYPRLKLARNLLRDEGVIFVSIADHEIHNLRAVMDEIFGPENFIATVIWHKMDSPKNTAIHFSEDHDYVLIFAKEAASWRPNGLERTEEMVARYKNPDNDPRGVWLLSDLAARNFYAQGRYPITTKSGKVIPGPPAGSYWRVNKERFYELDQDNRIWWGESGDNRPGIKRFLTEVRQGVVPQTYWAWKEVGSTRNAKQELSQLMGAAAGEDLFITPKPTKLVERMLQIATEAGSNDIVLDFFGGSATTGHATLTTNAKDAGNRRYVLVQLPEPTGDSKIQTIAELTKERLRRAGEKIKVENPLFAGDLGFRVFKLDSTNIREWDPNKDNLAANLEASVEHLKTDRSEQDILFELLLKLGLDLCVAIVAKMIGKHEVHSIGSGSLLVCLSPSIPLADVEPLAFGLVAWHKELKPAGETTVVFRDSAFADDMAKTNLAAILHQHGLENRSQPVIAMSKDLTTSEIDRQNILNNPYALAEIEKATGIQGIPFEGRTVVLKEQVASFFEVTPRTVDNYLEKFAPELGRNGYEVLRGNRLKTMKLAIQDALGHETNFVTKTTVLGVFDFRAFLNLAMLMTESQRAALVRQMILDIVIDTINVRTGGGTKYINQRDEDFIHSAFIEDNYRRQFTDALKECVAMGNVKYAVYTDKIYVSVFREKSKEYRNVLRLEKKDAVRETFYSEVLDLIASYECGFAEELRAAYANKKKMLTFSEVDDLFRKFESLSHWKPLIEKARNKMASRDLAFREALHLQLKDYVTPLAPSEFERFIGEKSKELAERLEDAKDVMKRLKERT